MSKTIFIVDDEEQIRDIFATILNIFYRNDIKDGHLIVHKFADGHEAVEGAKTNLPDFMMMDVSMPNMDGIEAFYAIKSLNGNMPVKTYFITGFASDGEIGKRMDGAIRDGALGYYSKPVSSDDIKKLVDTYLYGTN